MTQAELLLLGFDLALAGLEKYMVNAQMEKWKGEGKSDAEIGALLKEMLASEITAAKVDSLTKRSGA